MNNFEDKLHRLEELTDTIKQSDISLEDALKAFEEGIKLANGMEKELDNIESKIQILMNEPEVSSEEAEDSPKSSTTAKKTSAKKAAKNEPILDLFNGSTEVNGTRNA